ncbi:hypothetical protein [Peptoniphilus catoniae]|uniref:hypothetical protein n=1 Tax=Peptoniphilus catoniae TaxID=1660341 RepID=UPI0015D59042|nr:hypothetical protein [Peptoniphilus catoniae]
MLRKLFFTMLVKRVLRKPRFAKNNKKFKPGLRRMGKILFYSSRIKYRNQKLKA